MTMHSLLRRCVFTAIAGALTSAVSADAQSPTAPPEQETYWLMGGSLGVPNVGGESYFEATLLGFHVTSVNPGKPGLDLSVSIAPRTFTSGFVAGAITAGVVLPLEATPGLLLLPTAGVTLAGGAGGGGAEGVRGFHAGASFASVRVGKVGLRAGITGHRFAGVGGTVWLLELGLVGGR